MADKVACLEEPGYIANNIKADQDASVFVLVCDFPLSFHLITCFKTPAITIDLLHLPKKLFKILFDQAISPRTRLISS